MGRARVIFAHDLLVSRSLPAKVAQCRRITFAQHFNKAATLPWRKRVIAGKPNRKKSRALGCNENLARLIVYLPSGGALIIEIRAAG
jgi:hypothetical protein